MIRPLLYRTAELRKRYYRYVKFPGKGLQGAGYIGYFLLPGLVSSAAPRHELKIIDNDQIQIMLQFIFPAFGTELRNTDSGSIINNQVGIADYPCAFYELFPFRIGKVACTQMLGIHSGLYGK